MPHVYMSHTPLPILGDPSWASAAAFLQLCFIQTSSWGLRPVGCCVLREQSHKVVHGSLVFVSRLSVLTVQP